MAALCAASAAPAAEFLTPCRVPGLRSEVRCAVVERPLDPARPGGTRIGIHVVVIPAVARHKRPEPIFMLAGGPGQSAIAVAPKLLPLLARLNRRRDLVFVDQRGTGRSAPLACEEMAPLADRLSLEARIADALACRDRLEQLPHVAGLGGLAHYTTPVAVQDFEAVRERLGAGRVDLVGFSYGTRVALEWLRQAPARVRRSVLDGAAPPDMALPASQQADSGAALDATFAACEREPACAAGHPRLRDRWQQLLASLPREATVTDPLSGRPATVRMTRGALLALVRGPLYAPSLAAALPAAIDEATAGRYGGLVGLSAMQTASDEARPAAGMHFSVVCSEDWPLVHATPAAGDFAEAGVLYDGVCPSWPRGVLPPDYARIAPAASAVLILSGALDPATPPRHGARVAERLGAKARHVVAPNGGHGVLATACGRDVLQRFIEADTEAAALAVDASCVADAPRPPAFRLPSGGAAAAPLPR